MQFMLLQYKMNKWQFHKFLIIHKHQNTNNNSLALLTLSLVNNSHKLDIIIFKIHLHISYLSNLQIDFPSDNF